VEIIQQCPSCNSQGEITMNTERLILEMQIIADAQEKIEVLKSFEPERSVL